jgi:magnesium and cobalt transporter
VTLEDVLEELVGEIEDEFDLHEQPQVRRDGDRWVVPGSVSVRDLARELGMDIEDPHEATIGGHVVEELGRVPDPGETLRLEGLEVEVLESDEALVQRLRVRPVEEEPSE